jgi:hypothetical protein
MDASPNVNDVLFGRGRGKRDHIGNFRVIVGKFKNEYQSKTTIKQRKQAIVQFIYDEVGRLEGRFLIPTHKTSSLWYAVSAKRAKEKIGQALHEKSTDTRRRHRPTGDRYKRQSRSDVDNALNREKSDRSVNSDLRLGYGEDNEVEFDIGIQSIDDNLNYDIMSLGPPYLDDDETLAAWIGDILPIPTNVFDHENLAWMQDEDAAFGALRLDLAGNTGASSFRSHAWQQALITRQRGRFLLHRSVSDTELVRDTESALITCILDGNECGPLQVILQIPNGTRSPSEVRLASFQRLRRSKWFNNELISGYMQVMNLKETMRCEQSGSRRRSFY